MRSPPRPRRSSPTTPGCASPGPARAQVVDRASWVVGQRLVDAPAARAAHRAGRRTHGGSRVAPIGRRVAGTETGVLLGYLAQRVLGQYDLLVLDDDAAADAVYYVGGNILALEKRFAFRPRDFRLVDRDPRGHPPGAVHRRAVDEALLPVAGREHAVVDRSRPAPARAGAGPRGRGVPQRAQPARRRRPRRAARQRRAARRARQRAGAHVVARGPRQQRDEPARARARRRSGAHGASPPRAPAERGHGRVPAEARRPRVEDAPVRGGGGVHRRGRARGRARAASTPRGGARSSCPTVDELSRPNDWLARVDGAT